MSACGPRSGISADKDEPAVCGVKDYTLADTDKFIPRTEIEIRGFNLFKLHCRQCHVPPQINPENGVGLRGVFDRMPKTTPDYFMCFIRNSDSLLKNGDPYSNMIKDRYKSDYVHSFKDVLSAKELNDLTEYIKRPGGRTE